jgi:hypothetical protein
LFFKKKIGILAFELANNKTPWESNFQSSKSLDKSKLEKIAAVRKKNIFKKNFFLLI